MQPSPRNTDLPKQLPLGLGNGTESRDKEAVKRKSWVGRLPRDRLLHTFPSSLVFYSHFRTWASGNQGKAGKKEFGRLGSSPLSSLSSCLPSSASPSSVTLLIWGLGSSKQDSEATSYTCGRTDAACGWERLFRGLAVVFPHLAKVLSKQKYGCLLWTLVIQFSLRSQSSLSFPITSDQGAYVIGTKHLFGMGPFSISNVHEDSRVAAFMREAT